MISFYDLNSTNHNVPVSRIEDLPAIPLCMEYYRWPDNTEGKIETLLVGDGLGHLHKYDFTQEEWHTCCYKPGDPDTMECHKKEIQQDFKDKIE